MGEPCLRRSPCRVKQRRRLLRHMGCHVGRLACPVLVGSGGRESPEFNRRADTFAAVLAGMGRLHSRVVMPELNHFQVPNQLDDPGTPLGRAVPGMMLPGGTASA